MGKPQRDKGAAFERHIAKVMGARKMSTMYGLGADLDWNGYSVECKKRAGGFKTLYKWLEKDDAGMLVIAADYQPPLVVIPLDTFLDIIEERDTP